MAEKIQMVYLNTSSMQANETTKRLTLFFFSSGMLIVGHIGNIAVTMCNPVNYFCSLVLSKSYSSYMTRQDQM